VIESAKQKKIYTCCNLALKPLLEFLNQIKCKRNEVTEEHRRWRHSSVVVRDLARSFRSFHWPWTNQRPETVTLLPLGLVYLFLCFLCKVSIHHLLRLFYVCLLLKRKNWCLWKISASFFTYNLLLWRSIVTCKRCNLTLSPLINVWPTLTFAQWASTEG